VNFPKNTKILKMKVCILVLALAVTMASCQTQVAKPDDKKVNTKEMWAKIKNLFQTLKGKLTDPKNIGSAKDETKEQLENAADTFNDAMVGIGNNIYTFSLKVNSKADGETVQKELTALGQCGQQVLSASAVPMSEIIAILAGKTIVAAQKVELPADAPKVVADKIQEGAQQVQAAVEQARKDGPPTHV